MQRHIHRTENCNLTSYRVKKKRVRHGVVFAYYFFFVYSYRRTRSRACRTCVPPPGPGCRPSRTRPYTCRTVVHCVKDRLQIVRTLSDMFELTQAFISSVFDRSTLFCSQAYSLLLFFKQKNKNLFALKAHLTRYHDTLQYKPAPIKLVVKGTV
jgi:hypothetical protein